MRIRAVVAILFYLTGPSFAFQASVSHVASRQEAKYGAVRAGSHEFRLFAATFPRKHRHQGRVATAPLTLVKSTTEEITSMDVEKKKFDFDAVIKYGLAIAIQMGLIFGISAGLDMLVAKFNVQIPFAVNFLFFYFMALKSRILNPLANNRPSPQTLETDKEPEQKREMPSWTPPGFVFPIVWLLIIGPIRAATSAMVYQATQSYANPAIMSLMLHLSIGDVWNTINNVEKRYGVSVIGVLCVWLSKAYAAYRYYQVFPLAGKLLGATLFWLTIATALIATTWRLNPDPNTCKPEPIYPVAGKKRTEFAWFSTS